MEYLNVFILWHLTKALKDKTRLQPSWAVKITNTQNRMQKVVSWNLQKSKYDNGYKKMFEA